MPLGDDRRMRDAEREYEKKHDVDTCVKCGYTLEENDEGELVCVRCEKKEDRF